MASRINTFKGLRMQVYLRERLTGNEYHIQY